MFFCYFPDWFLRQTCVYVYMYIIFVVLVVVCILFCAEEKRRSRDESRHHGKGRTDEISVLSLLSSYLRWEVSKEGQLSYPNFVRGLLLDDMQPLIGRFEILGTLCCTICEVPRRAENQKEVGLRDPWKFRDVTEIERRYFSQSVSFRNFFES